MQYVVVVLIVLVVIYVVVKAILEMMIFAFEMILGIIKAFPYLCFSIAVTLATFFIKDLKTSLYVVALLIGLKIIGLIMIHISNFIKKRRIKKRIKKLKKYLRKKYLNAGYITKNDIVRKLPNRLKKEYPHNENVDGIIEDFLEKKTGVAYDLILSLIMDEMTEKGMDDKRNVEKNVVAKLKPATYCVPYEIMFDKAIEDLVDANRIDLPTKDKKAIHLIGAEENKVSNMTQVDYSNLL